MNQIAKKDHILYICSSSLIFLLVISALVLSHTTLSAHADDSVITTTSITVSESCSMTGTVDTPHTAELPNGTYSGTNHPEGIGTTTLKAFCNDGMGFAIYAIGYTDDIYGYTTLHSEEIGSNYDISTALYQTGNTNSSWSMKLTSIPGDFAPTIANGTNEEEDFTTWHVVPNDYQKVAYKATGTDILVNNVGTGSSLTVTYDAYISPTQPAGTYVGQVKYTLVHPSTAGKPALPPGSVPMDASDCPAGYVCYAPNTSDIVGSMSSISEETITSSPTAGKISVGTSATTINLIAPNYKREGYGFAGWSTDFTATNASTIYGPNETLTVPSTTLATNGMILYPVWVASAGNLQGWTGCNNLTQATYDSTNNKMVATLSSVTALTDTRDGNVYAVARLADGKCWMIENLRLADTHNDNGNIVTTIITTSNTNNPLNTNGTVNLKTNYSSGTTANHLASTSDSWCAQFYYVSCTDQTMLNTNNTNYGGKNTSNTDLIPGYNTNTATAQWYSYGNYYNWYSATAGNGTYSKSSGDVDGDLCPTDWHLPYGNNSGTGNTVGGFCYLNTQMANNTSTQGSKDLRSFPNNLVYSGNFNGSSANQRGYCGHYWSSSANNSNDAYALGLSSSFVGPGTNSINKNFGLSVRCIAGS